MKCKFSASAFLFLAGFYFPAALVHAQPGSVEIGTLFTTPAERDYLDFLRQDFLLQNPEDDFNVDEEVPPVPIITEDTDEEVVQTVRQYKLSGIFSQRDGSRVVWLNDVSIQERNLPENMQLLGTGPMTILRITTDDASYDLKAGQTLDVGSGDIFENWRVTPGPSAEAGLSDAAAEDNSATTATTVIAAVEEDSSDDNAAENIEDPDSIPGLTDMSPEELRDLLGEDEVTDADELAEILRGFQEAQENGSIQ